MSGRELLSPNDERKRNVGFESCFRVGRTGEQTNKDRPENRRVLDHSHDLLLSSHALAVYVMARGMPRRFRASGHNEPRPHVRGGPCGEMTRGAHRTAPVSQRLIRLCHIAGIRPETTAPLTRETAGEIASRATCR